jgi:HSP20 family molecular chaperone IbpA
MSDLPISEIENMISDYEKSDIKKIGFAVHIGPDGKPHVRPLNKNNFMKTNKSNILSKSGFIVPFTDIFYNRENKSYQIVSEIQGIKNLENVHLLKDNNDPTSFTLHAETGPFKYKKLIKLKRQVNLSSSIYKLNNGVLEINISVDN